MISCLYGLVEKVKSAILERIDSLIEDGAFTSEASVTHSDKEGHVYVLCFCSYFFGQEHLSQFVAHL